MLRGPEGEKKMQKTIAVSLVIVLGVLAVPAVAPADAVIPVTLTLTTPGSSNIDTISVSGTGALSDLSGSDTTPVSGTIDIEITALNLTSVAPIEVRFTGGSLSAGDVSFNATSLLGSASFSATGLGGTTSTPSPPSSVTPVNPLPNFDGNFATGEHQVVVNEGTATVDSSSSLLQAILSLPDVRDLSTDPLFLVDSSTPGTSSILVTDLGGGLYQVDLSIPFNTSQVLYNNTDTSGLGTVILTQSGTLFATGTFQTAPEPATVLLLCLGGLSLAAPAVRRRRVA